MAYSDGRFEDALQHFERAYELSDRAALLYNIGAAAERLGKNGKALEMYEQYLEKKPEADNRRFVESRIRILSERQGEAEDESEATASGSPSGAPADGAQAEATEDGRADSTVPTPRQAAEAEVSSGAQASGTAPSEDTSESVLKKWWFWTAVGAVVLGAVAVGVVVGTQGGGQGGPKLTSDDGNVYRALREAP
jgi:tetratricopeptide (TPR) repeat protein